MCTHCYIWVQRFFKEAIRNFILPPWIFIGTKIRIRPAVKAAIFYLSQEIRGGAFVGEHGSWNRSQFNGYKVAFVPFKNGKPSGPPEDFLTGFIADETKNEVYGRPVGVIVLADGSLLVADDAGNTIWKVSRNKM